MSKTLIILATIVLVIHGLIHVMGAVVYLGIAEIEGLPYRTSLLGGLLEVGDAGMRIYGVLWGLAAFGFLAAAFGRPLLWTGRRRLLAAAALLSLALCGLGYQDAFAAIPLNLAILATLWLAPRRPAIDRLFRTATSAGVIALLAVFLAGCVDMQPSIVEPGKYLGRQSNPEGIYREDAAATVLPVFDIRFDPMDRLMLVNFADDPVYEAIELQIFDAEDGGESALVLLARRGGDVDVFTTRNHVLTDDSRAGIEALMTPGTVTFQTADFAYRFIVGPHGLDAALDLVDRAGKLVSFEIVETKGEPRIGALIAPVGARSSEPEYLPLIFLDEFALVKHSGTRIRITIDGHDRQPDKMTRLLKGPAVYFTRYATRLVIASWNERREAALQPVSVAPGETTAEAGGMSWRLRWNGAHPETESVTATTGRDIVEFQFSPALPDLAALREGVDLAGRFVISVNDVPGITAGDYRVARAGDEVTLEIQPRLAWQPPILKGPSWVASYRYEARVDLSAEVPVLTSAWSRVDG
jgi:hypothetical protein